MAAPKDKVDKQRHSAKASTGSGSSEYHARTTEKHLGERVHVFREWLNERARPNGFDKSQVFVSNSSDSMPESKSAQGSQKEAKLNMQWCNNLRDVLPANKCVQDTHQSQMEPQGGKPDMVFVHPEAANPLDWANVLVAFELKCGFEEKGENEGQNNRNSEDKVMHSLHAMFAAQPGRTFAVGARVAMNQREGIKLCLYYGERGSEGNNVMFHSGILQEDESVRVMSQLVNASRSCLGYAFPNPERSGCLLENPYVLAVAGVDVDSGIPEQYRVLPERFVRLSRVAHGEQKPAVSFGRLFADSCERNEYGQPVAIKHSPEDWVSGAHELIANEVRMLEKVALNHGYNAQSLSPLKFGHDHDAPGYVPRVAASSKYAAVIVPVSSDITISSIENMTRLEDIVAHDNMREYVRTGKHDFSNQMNGPIEAEQALHVLKSLYNVLRGCHDAGVVHLDVQPQNCIMYQGSYALIDFGLATTVGSKPRKGRVNGFVGTNAFSSMRIQAEKEKERTNEEEHLQYMRRDDFESLMFLFYELICPTFSRLDSNGIYLEKGRIATDKKGKRVRQKKKQVLDMRESDSLSETEEKAVNIFLEMRKELFDDKDNEILQGEDKYEEVRKMTVLEPEQIIERVNRLNLT